MAHSPRRSNEIVPETGSNVVVVVQPHYLRRKDAARFLGVAPGTLAQWAKKKSGKRGPPYLRTSYGVTLYPVRELEQFLAASVPTAGAPGKSAE